MKEPNRRERRRINREAYIASKPKRVRRNTAERGLQEKMESLGWEVTKRGWPDFVCVKDDKIIFVEVKKDAMNPLRREQRRLMEILHAAGLACFRWDPESGFTDWDRKPMPFQP